MNSLTKGKILAYLAIIFIAGGATGAVIMMRKDRGQQAQPASVEKACTRFQDRLILKLELTPAQVRKLQPVFDQTTHDLRAIHAKALRHADEVIRRAHEEIARELTPEQKLKLQALDQEREDWLRRRVQSREHALEP
jgi:Spy/CpxP family protein refolding chaperone